MTFHLKDSPYIVRIVGSFGDVNAPDYDGGFVFVHSQGETYDWEYVETPPEDRSYQCPHCDGQGSNTCGYSQNFSHRESCDDEVCDGDGDYVCIKCRGSGINPDIRWTVYRGLVDEPDWADWDEVGRYAGQDPEEYRRIWKLPSSVLITDEIVMERMRSIEDVASYWGWHNFDNDPLEMSHAEIMERYKGFDPYKLSRKEIANVP